MAPAFVPGCTTTVGTTFTGRSLSKCHTSTSALRMSASPISRRQALSAAATLVAGAALSPFAASAKSGDSPKISIFGVGGASSPFTAGIQRGGTVQYKSFNEEEVARYQRIISESKDRLEGASDSIKSKSWEDIRSRIRLEAYDLRQTQLTVNDNISDSKQAEAAKKAYSVFKIDLENLDQAAVQKNQDKAYKAYNASLKSLAAWQSAVGF